MARVRLPSSRPSPYTPAQSTVGETVQTGTEGILNHHIITPTALRGLAVLALIALGGCQEGDGGSASCNRDPDCPRGTICEDERCTEVPCANIGACPGSGRTCLADLRACSPQECNTPSTACEAGESCITTGPFRNTCIAGDLACTTDGECSSFGDGFACCGGECRTDCPEQDAVPVDPEDMGPAADQGPATDGDPPPADGGGPDPDMAPPTGGELCARCAGDGDCAALGEGAECTPIGNTGSFCTSACGGPGDCPDGFTCLDAVGQCIPVNYDCEKCPAAPCEAGSVCDVASGACVPPRQACEPCTGADCAPGLECAQAGGQAVCLADCSDGGMCPAGYACDGALCQPEGGACDACGGSCAPPTPVCLQDQARCVECDAVTPCGEGLVCDPATNTCENEGAGCACAGDVDCGDCLGLPICYQQRCVACLEDADCPPRFACTDNQQCVRSPCSGVTCQRGTRCDAQSGICVNAMTGAPGCAGPQDCALPDSMNCNQETGQCFYSDGTCDPGGGDGVCPPGSNCTLNAFLMQTYCTCKKVDPIGQPLGPDLVPCHPGGFCAHGETFPGSMEAAPEGACLIFGF